MPALEGKVNKVFEGVIDEAASVACLSSAKRD